MTTRLLSCVALVITLGIVTHTKAEPQLKTDSVSNELGHDFALHLALGHFKEKSSLGLANRAEKGFSVAFGRAPDLHLHGYRDPQGGGTVPNPEPATMLLFGSGLVGFAVAVRRKRRARR